MTRFLDFGGVAARKKKKKRKLILFASIAFAVLASVFIIRLCSTQSAYAADSGKTEAEIENELKSETDALIDRLELDSLQKFIDSLDEKQRAALSIDDIKTLLKKLVNGEQGSFFDAFLELALNSAGGYFAGFIPSFVTIIIICLLNSLLGGMTGNFLNNSTTEVVHVVCYCAVIIVLMTGVVDVVQSVAVTIDNLSSFAAVIFPLLLTLLSMLGGATSVAAYSPFMAVLSGMVMKLVSVVILPAFIATIVFSVVGNISKTVKLEKITKLIKSASTWLIGIVFGLFATFLTMQGITGGVIDKFGFNAAKFALSSYVPILGGYLSDGFDLLTASLVLVKNALGYTGATVLVSSVLFPLMRLVVFMLTVRLTAAIAEPVGDERVARLLNALADNMSLLITALAGVAFMFFILLMLLIGSCNMGI